MALRCVLIKKGLASVVTEVTSAFYLKLTAKKRVTSLGVTLFFMYYSFLYIILSFNQVNAY